MSFAAVSSRLRANGKQLLKSKLTAQICIHSLIDIFSVKSLAIALQELDVVLPRRDLTPAQEDGLDRLHKACEKLLIELRTTLDENQVAIPTKTKRSILKVAWLRAQWDQKEIDVLRNRLIQILTGFQTFLQLVTR
jgi:hypothetical protein